MAQTSISSATAYATPTDLMNAYSVSKIGAWAAGPGQPALTQFQILTNPIVASALMRASGRLEAACARGGRYFPADLAALTGVSQAFMVELVSTLAAHILAKRYLPEPDKIGGYEDAAKILQDLNDGGIIFSFQETVDAGNPANIDLKFDAQGKEQRVTERYRRLFGKRERHGCGDNR